MTEKPFDLNTRLSVVVQSGEEPPYAADVSLRRLAKYLTGAALAYFLLFLGTLLFFRELELNRKLQEHVLKLESEKRLYQAYPLPDRAPSAQVPQNTQAAAEPMPAPPPRAETRPLEVFGRIGDLRAECLEEDCTIRLKMVTTQPGTAVGQLLLVLETEVPRIGGADPNAPVRKRFFLYPGGQAVDELDPNTLSSLTHKSFRFSRALQSSAVFKVGKLLRPLAINAYVFDPEKSLLQHERRPIETEE